MLFEELVRVEHRTRPLALAIGELFGKPVEEIFGEGCGKKR
jgi:DNA-binding XRE family transcriptional regulator